MGTFAVTLFVPFFRLRVFLACGATSSWGVAAMGSTSGSAGSGDGGRGGDTGSGDGGDASSGFPVMMRVRDVPRGTSKGQTRFLP